MPRCIDADELKELREKYILGEVQVNDEYDLIDRCPTIDAVPVVHGRWIDVREYCGDYMCSNCETLYGTNKFNYCPNCGAKMDGGVK